MPGHIKTGSSRRSRLFTFCGRSRENLAISVCFISQMGNQQGQQDGKGSSSIPSSSDPLEAQRKRLLAAFQLWVGRTKAQECLNREHFQNVLFPFHPVYGGVLYDFMSVQTEGGGGAASTGLTAGRYVEVGLDILHPPTSQLDSCFNIFSGRKKCITKQEVCQLLSTCHRVMWQCTGLTIGDNSNEDVVIKAVIDNLFGQSEEIPQSDFTSWCGRHCVHLCEGIHQITSAVLLGEDDICKQAAGAEASQPESEFAQQVAAGGGPLTSASLWLLTTSLPASYFPSADGAGGSAAVNLNLPLLQVCSPSGWHLLYDSNEQGLSVNRFQHHVFEYKGPTLMFVSFSGHMYCIAADTEWREGRQRFGGSDCCLIQMHPKYTVMQAGADMLYVNFGDRTAPRGLQVGKDTRTTFLSVDEGLSKVTHYGIPTDLHRLQVWGCAGLLTREAQQRQKDWEKRQAQRGKDRKIKLDDWENNPDKQILEMGGVTTEHAQR